MTQQEVFTADLNRMNAKFQALGAVISGTDPDGTVWQAIDPSKAPAVLTSAYSGLISYGYANGLI